MSSKSSEIKTKAINFRVPESVWQATHERAVLAGKGVNEWARDELAGRLDEEHGLTPGERLIYVEINNLRNLVEAMMLAGMNSENEERYAEALEQSIATREAAARDYFAQLAEVGVVRSGGGADSDGKSSNGDRSQGGKGGTELRRIGGRTP